MNQLMLTEHKDRVVVSSRAVAEKFGKRHDNVIAAIREIIEGLLKNKETPDAFFLPAQYANEQNGQLYPEFFCTRDGFSLLAMGFTGDEALRWKLQYIQAFNAMEALVRERMTTEWLVTRKHGKLVRRSETDSLARLIPYAEEQGSKSMRKKAYLIYTKLVHDLVGIEAGQRDSAPFKVLSTIMFLEDMILHTVEAEMQSGTFYKEIYQKCKRNGEQIMCFAYLDRLTA